MSASTEKKLRQAAREAGNDKKAIARELEAKQKAKSKLRWRLGTVAVVLLIAAILFLNSNYFYTSTTALRIGDESYSPAQVSYYYATQYYNTVNQYGSYAGMLGLDTSAGLSGLKDQTCPMLEEEGSWRDYFLSAAKNSMQQVKAVKDYAAEQGIELTAEDQAAVDAELATLDEAARSMGYANANGFLAANYGRGVDTKLVKQASYDAALVNRVVNEYTDSLSYSPEELEEKYDSYQGEQDYYEYVYYYVMAETVSGEDGTVAATDETKAKAKADAEAVLTAYQASAETDVEARMNAALAEAGLTDAACTHSNNTGAALGTYKEWVMSQTESGEATVIASSGDTGFYVVAYIGHNDNDYDLVNIRHILVRAVADENGVYTDEAKAEAKAKAEELLAQWESGEATEESFALLANETSEDAGSNTNGGLYENVRMGQMVKEFDAFCFADHEIGDTGIVYGESASYAGYHVMYFAGEGGNARDEIARSELAAADSQVWMEDLLAGYEPIEESGMQRVG